MNTRHIAKSEFEECSDELKQMKSVNSLALILIDSINYQY